MSKVSEKTGSCWVNFLEEIDLISDMEIDAPEYQGDTSQRDKTREGWTQPVTNDRGNPSVPLSETEDQSGISLLKKYIYRANSSAPDGRGELRIGLGMGPSAGQRRNQDTGKPSSRTVP
ncbi:hypothetical protein JTB14_015749 [Gonioctena quinquepunctata]|nr:hypothetical protein JTB14_015749 [Gonioctena quinquepunctata]